MISFNEAFKKVLDQAKILGYEKLPVDESLGYVLAEDIVSEYDIPHFNKSAMDGYAVRYDDLKYIPVKLKCIDIIRTGQVFKKTVNKGECVKIMTGSLMPEGTDSVVMVEHTETAHKNKGLIKIFKKVDYGENVCLKGEDIKKGRTVLKKGALIRGPEVSIISSLGMSIVRVYKKPTVAVLSTGDEIIEPGKSLVHGKIYNSNGHMFLSLFKEMGIKARYLGIVKDEEKKLKKAVMNGLKSDILLLSGGVSMGDYDLVPGVLKKCGVKKVFHKVRMKPGKPLFFGVRNNRLVFGIPGNPVPAYLIYFIFIKPVVDKLMGKKLCLNVTKGIMKKDYRRKPGRKHFVPVLYKNDGSVYPVENYHGSADISSLTRANGFMVMPASAGFIKKGQDVELLLW